MTIYHTPFILSLLEEFIVSLLLLIDYLFQITFFPCSTQRANILQLDNSIVIMCTQRFCFCLYGNIFIPKILKAPWYFLQDVVVFYIMPSFEWFRHRHPVIFACQGYSLLDYWFTPFPNISNPSTTCKTALWFLL
jgi:hypothetical protein